MPVPPELNPLKTDDCCKLADIQQSIAQTKQLIDACKECGLPMEGRDAENEQQANLVRSLRAQFDPNSP